MVFRLIFKLTIMNNVFCRWGLMLLLVTLGGCSGDHKENSNVDDQFHAASISLSNALSFMNDTTLNPRSLQNESVRYVKSGDWTSGFFPGILWMMYEYTNESYWKEKAQYYTMNVENEMYNGRTHDMGFKMYCSFGNGYRLTGDPVYKDILAKSASTLISRFNPTVGCIRSWDHNADKWDFPVIIDNMMNLELLFWAFRESGDSVYYNIAVEHAETTLRNHFRDDFSSFHVISYDTLTGAVEKKNTHQGYSHESAWARGQAWGLYGYTMTYRETGDERFLELAKNIAQYILSHPNLPKDKIPFWDFDAPGQPDIPRDVSAAAITASALYELQQYCPDHKEEFLDAADAILETLSSDKYLLSGDHNFPFLLDHSVGNYNKSEEVDTPIIYADYYFLEALLRKRTLHENK